VEPDPFAAWLDALEKRHLRDLTFAEVRRALQALSSLYVERRGRLASGAALESAGKRAAFALYYGPLHFLLVRAIVRALGAAVARPARVVDLGCGTGAFGVALLEMGASRVTGVDLSPASIDLARRRADDAGYAEVSAFEVGDAAETDAEPHDWVVLDRVICCYGDVDRLIGRAIDLARERIVISVPESRGWRGLVNRPLWFAEFIWDRVHGGCRGYVHDLRRIERRLAAAGFELAASERLGLWHIGVYERPKTSDSPDSRSRGA
jgi:magnesium-protoporphyrin O-methyltransferase